MHQFSLILKFMLSLKIEDHVSDPQGDSPMECSWAQDQFFTSFNVLSSSVSFECAQWPLLTYHISPSSPESLCFSKPSSAFCISFTVGWDTHRTLDITLPYMIAPFVPVHHFLESRHCRVWISGDNWQRGYSIAHIAHVILTIPAISPNSCVLLTAHASC